LPGLEGGGAEARAGSEIVFHLRSAIGLIEPIPFHVFLSENPGALAITPLLRGSLTAFRAGYVFARVNFYVEVRGIPLSLQRAAGWSAPDGT